MIPLVAMVEKIMSPNNVHVQIPETYKYVTLYSKGGFEYTITLRIWRWGD